MGISFRTMSLEACLTRGTYLDHGLDNTEETLVRGEQPVSASEGITLQPPLQRVLREHLDDPTAIVGRLWIPLEVSVGDFEAFVELVRVELVGREDPESLWVELDHLGDVRPDPALTSAGSPAEQMP